MNDTNQLSGYRSLTEEEELLQLNQDVALVVMGWHRHESGEYYDRNYTSYGSYAAWRPVYDAVQALKVVTRMRELGFNFELHIPAHRCIRLLFFHRGKYQAAGDENVESIPLSICRAAYGIMKSRG